MTRKVITSAIRFASLSALCVLIVAGCSDLRLRMTIDDRVLGWTRAVVLTTPENNGTRAQRHPLLDWQDAGGASGYQLQVASTQGQLDASPLIEVKESQYALTDPLTIGDTRYWRVRAVNANGQFGAWSETWTFRVVVSQTPKVVSTTVCGAHTSFPLILGNLAYVCMMEEGLKIYDISNPAAPSPLNTYTDVQPYDLVVLGNYLYVNEMIRAGGGRFSILDITDPVHPVLKGSIATNNGTFFVWNDCAFLSGSGVPPTRIDVIDVSNPLSLSFVGSYQPGPTGWGFYIAFDGVKTAILNVENNGIHTFDVFTKTFVGFLSVPDCSAFSMAAIKGSVAYVGSGSPGLLVVDISKPASPQLITSFPTGGVSLSLALGGNYLYVGDTVKGLMVYDITNPAAPLLVCSYTDTSAFTTVSGDYGYVCDFNVGTFIIVDLLAE
jgi:hypothetical protein